VLSLKALLTGAAGQVASAVRASAPPQVELTALTRAQLDISDEAVVRRAVSACQPSLLINTAAYTAVDKAESEPAAALAINADGPRYLARAAEAIPHCRLVHLSTDYVFDGAAAEAYRPTEATHPLSVYGRSKLEGERAVLGVLPERAVILRTAWVYSATGRNFLTTMLRLMRECAEVRVVADQFGNPTSANSIAAAIWAVAHRPQVRGILHWTDAGTASWYDFAVAIAEEGSAAGLLPTSVKVTPISTTEYPTAARRPANSVLDTREAIAQLGFAPPAWRQALRTTLSGMRGT
jgi:dTDP-4-dehydrorhamnose reductase